MNRNLKDYNQRTPKSSAPRELQRGISKPRTTRSRLVGNPSESNTLGNILALHFAPTSYFFLTTALPLTRSLLHPFGGVLRPVQTQASGLLISLRLPRYPAYKIYPSFRSSKRFLCCPTNKVSSPSLRRWSGASTDAGVEPVAYQGSDAIPTPRCLRLWGNKHLLIPLLSLLFFRPLKNHVKLLELYYFY